jgi:uncharacterized protein (TIGR03435 family)
MATAQSQTPQERLTFEVASVKPSPPGAFPNPSHPLPGNQTYRNRGVSLRLLMVFAYSVPERRISGGSSWINTDLFDIDAKAARPGAIDALRTMVQHLLEDRFQLKVRRETREQPVWDMVVDKAGATMPVHDPQYKDDPPLVGPQMINGHGPACPGFIGSNLSMNYLAFLLSRTTDRNVIDKTGLTAHYDVNLRYVLDPANPAPPDGAGPAVSLDCPDIVAALREQLGLRLESAKGPVEYLVVEHAEKPTEN